MNIFKSTITILKTLSSFTRIVSSQILLLEKVLKNTIPNSIFILIFLSLILITRSIFCILILKGFKSNSSFSIKYIIKIHFFLIFDFLKLLTRKIIFSVPLLRLIPTQVFLCTLNFPFILLLVFCINCTNLFPS